MEGNLSRKVNYFNNRKFNSNEQINHWRNNWRNGVIRFVERVLTRRNISDLLGGNLTHINHLPEVRSQLKNLKKINDGELLPQLIISPINGGYRVALDEVIQPQLALELNHLNVDIRSGLAQLDSGFVIDSTLVQWQRLLFRGGMAHSVARLSKKIPEKPGTWIVLPFSPYYFHTLVEDLPLILEARKINPHAKVLTSGSNPKWTFELLDLLDIEFESTELNACKFENYIAITSPRGISHRAVTLIRSAARVQTKLRSRKIFITRGSSLDRSDADLESAIMNELTALGFEAINPSGIPVSEQIELFSSAQAIIGLHGGALTNMIWSEPGARVMEIFNHPYRTHDFARLAAACHHNYSCFELDLDTPKVEIAKLIASQFSLGNG